MDIENLLLKIKKENSFYGFSARAEHNKIIMKYFNEDCVIAYNKTQLGIILIIKGSRKNFAFYCIRNDILNQNAFSYNMESLDLIKIVKMLKEEEEIILMPNEYDKITKQILIEELRNENENN